MLRDELGVGGGVALPARLGADQDRDAAVRIEPHLGALARSAGAGLDIGREADATEPAGLFRSAAPRPEAGPIGRLDGAAHVAFEVAGIVDAAGAGLVGQLVRRDEVERPDGVRRLPELARDVVDEALDGVGRLRPPGAAIGIDRQGGRVIAANADVDGRNIVKPRRQEGAIGRHERPVLREIGAEIGLEIDAQGEEAAASVDRHLQRRDVVASLRVAEEMLAAVGEPLDRPP
jgi:hypothetical protein